MHAQLYVQPCIAQDFPQDTPHCMTSGTAQRLMGNSKTHSIMATYSKGAGDKVERAMKEKQEGSLKSGRSGKKVTSRKQAIAIGLSEARKEGAKVPKKKSATKKAATKKAASSKS
jgi:hypothetical protein